MKYIFCNLPLHACSPIIVIIIPTIFNYNIDFPNRSLLFTLLFQQRKVINEIKTLLAKITFLQRT